MLSSNFKLKIRSGESFLYRKEGTESQVFELRMRDKVSHFALQNACRKALKRFPYFNSSFKIKGESIYLVRNKVKPAVERRRHLRPLGGARTQKNMLDITFYDKSIFVAFHHGMCDGRGIMPFIKTLMYYYLRRVYKLRELIARQKELDSGRCSASIIKNLSDTLDKLSTYEEKSAMAERMAGMAANTFNLSYTGRANMGDAEQYIESIHPYMSGSKGVCIQMMSIGDVITVDFLQSFGSSMYVDAFCKQCRELGLKFTGSQAIPFSTPRDRIRNKSVMKLLQKMFR